MPSSSGFGMRDFGRLDRTHLRCPLPLTMATGEEKLVRDGIVNLLPVDMIHEQEGA
jgi:hypothetical protein